MDPGAIIDDRYRVTEVLGRGSFGTTYAAEDLQPSDLQPSDLQPGARYHPRVAIKQLDLRHVDDWKVVELFEREARVLASLDHPQIPNYVDALSGGEGQHSYLVQELAPGRSLADRLAAGQRFDEAEVRAIAEQLLDVLVYLSSRLPPVIHRDIKPSNVILSDDGRCYLVDFGSVRDAIESSDTGGSTVAGTFGYMAPEQLHGAASPASDLYGLGMTLVHLLTGTAPAELERHRLRVDFRKHLSLSEDFADFIDRLIEPVPEDRFASPQAAATRLRGLAPELGPALGPAPGGLSGEAIAATVAHAAREAEEAERRARALAARKAEDVARRSRPRVSLVQDGEGFTLTVAPVSVGFRFLVQLPIFAFLTANPGFAIAGGFPFLGPLWPVFADDALARWIIWVAFMMLVNLVVATWIKRAPLHLRVAGGHYLAWTRDPQRPLAAGTVDQLVFSISGLDDAGRGSFALVMSDESRSFSRLCKRDLEILERARASIDRGQRLSHASPQTSRDSPWPANGTGRG